MRAELQLRKQISELQQEKEWVLPDDEFTSQIEKFSLVTDQSSQTVKITLFRSLFRGREDVYPRRFENLKTGKKGYWPVRRNRLG